MEILLAFAVITLALTAVISLVFANQSLAEDIAASGDALSKAEDLLEEARATARFDFRLLVPASGLEVLQRGPYAKQAVAAVPWEPAGRQQSITLSTVLTDPEGSERGESCSSIVSGDWSRASLGPGVPLGTTGQSQVASMLAVDKKVYAAATGSSGHADDFYIYDASSDALALSTSTDLNGVSAGVSDLALSSTTSGFYIYAASAHTPSNWITCAESASCAQVLVLDPKSPNSLIARNYKIPAASAPFVTGGHANAVAYSAGYLYVGLSQTTSGPQFVVLDVGGGGPPASPASPVYAGGYGVGSGVSDIAVRRGVAYVAATDHAKELLMLDVSDPRSPRFLGAYSPPGSTGFGTANSVSVIGSTVYLGRTYDNPGPEWFAIDASNPAAPKSLASLNVGTSSIPQSVNSSLVRGRLLFLTARDSVQVWDMASSSAPKLHAFISLAALGTRGTASACEGNTVYIGGYRTSESRGLIYKLEPGL